MSSCTVSTNGSTATLALSGRFDFSSHRDFHESCDEVFKNGALRSIVLDFGAVDYVDSSALGMMLLLKERAEKVNSQLSIVNCPVTVRQILEVANFHKIFSLS